MRTNHTTLSTWMASETLPVRPKKAPPATGGVLRISLPRRWVNRRYDASSVDDPGYTDTVLREDFDRIADLSEAEGWDRRVLMGPPRPGSR
jgi:hypothetical protein